MGTCKYCEKPAGLLRNTHPECEHLHNRLILEVFQAISGLDNFDELEKNISDLARHEQKAILINGWEKSVDLFLEDGILDEAEEKRLAEFKEHFSLSQDELDRNGALTKIVKSAVLREILNGQIPQSISFDSDLPINLQKGEQVVWAFPASKYLEDKTRRQYVGRSQGVSVRLMKGFYYRVGSFKGQAVEYTDRIHLDTGIVFVTNKNLYFAGSRKSLRLPYSKIVSFEPFSDGIGIIRDAASAKPQIFVTGDGWFTYNLVTNLARL